MHWRGECVDCLADMALAGITNVIPKRMKRLEADAQYRGKNATENSVKPDSVEQVGTRTGVAIKMRIFGEDVSLNLETRVGGTHMAKKKLRHLEEVVFVW